MTSDVALVAGLRSEVLAGLSENERALRDGGWLTPQALIVVEEAADAGFKAPEGFEELERRAYDDTEFTFLRSA